MSLSLVSLNIERSKHLDRVLPFLRERMPDVIFLQEVQERDVPRLEQELGMPCTHVPLSHGVNDGNPGLEGIALLSPLPVEDIQVEWYVGNAEHAVSGPPREGYEDHALLCARVVKGGERYALGTTHFCWTPHGEPDERQRLAVRALLESIYTLGELVLCGDFNAPRGGEIFARLAAVLKDNIPENYVTSLDMELHRAAKTRPEEIGFRMVDGLFTTRQYRAENVELISGVSDHCAVVADIVKV